MMLFPTTTEKVNKKFPYATWALIIINALVFWWQLQIPPENLRSVYLDVLVVPANIMANPFSPETLLDIMRSTFMHGSFGHIIGNMLFLLLFGANVERKIGVGLFLFLYLISGFTAALLHVIFFPTEIIPALGASGAISGLMGLYLVLFPRSKIRGLFPLGAILYPFFYPILGDLAFVLFFILWYMEWPAWIFLGIILFRDASGAIESLNTINVGGTGHFAHLGGFLPGMIFGLMIHLARLSNPKKKWKQQLLY